MTTLVSDPMLGVGHALESCAAGDRKHRALKCNKIVMFERLERAADSFPGGPDEFADLLVFHCESKPSTS